MRKIVVAAVLAVTLLCGAAGCASQQAYEGSAFVMDTVFTARLEGRDAEAAYGEMTEMLREFEAVYSLYDENSQTRKLSDAAGKGPVALDPLFVRRLVEIQRLCRESGGRFDITIAPLSVVWNISGGGPSPPQDAIAAARELVGIDGLVIDEVRSTAALERAGMGVDLGGIAKGIALDELRRLCDSAGVTRGVFSLGGSVYVRGDKGGGMPYVVGLRNPDTDSGVLLGSIEARDVFITTSGAYERFFEENGVRYHHILDPATGYPAQSDIDSVTVVNDDAMMGDYLSTVLFMMGRDAALAEIRGRNERAIVVSGGAVYVSEALHDGFTLLDERYAVEVI